MNFNELVNKTFQEKELYDLLLTELEDNFELNFSQFIHFYFERLSNQKIRITELIHFKNSKELNQKSREIIEKKEWYAVCENHGHLNLILCRFDRTGFVSSIYKDSTHTQDWKMGWADEEPNREPMTREEIRQAILELMGVFQDEKKQCDLRFKKSI